LEWQTTMSPTDFLILYTPVFYAVFIVALYFLSYLKDPLRFIHPHRQSGEEMWPTVLLRLKLITEDEYQQSVQNRRRKVPKGYALVLSFAVVSAIGGWIFSLFYSIIMAAVFSLLFQFVLALATLSLVIISNLGNTAHVWKKHMSRIGSPKSRLSSRVLYLAELKQVEKRGLKRREKNEVTNQRQEILPEKAIGGETTPQISVAASQVEQFSPTPAAVAAASKEQVV